MIIKPKPKTVSILPKVPTQGMIDPAHLVILLIGPPKWGKTKFSMSNPKAIHLGFEEGAKFQRGYKMSIVKWDQKRGHFDAYKNDEGVSCCTAMQAVTALEEDTSDKFNMVVIDTVDMAVKMSSDYFCEIGNVEYPSDLGDYGKGWDKAINSPLRKLIMRILKTQRGVILITHSKTEIAKFTSGEKARKEMSLGKGPRSFCESQADVIMHGELGRKRPGKRLRDRILVCEGDMDTLAGNRSGAMLPERYIVDPENPWKQFERFFRDAKAADIAEAQYRKLTTGGGGSSSKDE